MDVICDCYRMDVICDYYFKDSFRIKRAKTECQMIQLFLDAKLPSDFKGKSLKSSKNKNRLKTFLAPEFLFQYSGGKILIITKDETVLSVVEYLVTDITLSLNSAEEANQKLVCDTLQCIRSSIGKCFLLELSTLTSSYFFFLIDI